MASSGLHSALRSPTGYRDATNRRAVAKEWEQTVLDRRHKSRVRTGKPNDFLVAVTPSSKTSGSGSGKTTVGTSLAKEWDISDDGFDAECKATLDANAVPDLLDDADEGSAILFDEAQGTPAGTGVNARRFMSNDNLEAINGILANRDGRLTVLIVAQFLNMVDVNLLPMFDAWLLIRRDPGQKGGPLMTHHVIHQNDYNLGSKDIKTPAIEDLEWPALPNDDPDYLEMERKKQVAKAGKQDGDEDDDGSGGLGKPAQKQLAQSLRDHDCTLEQIADDPRISYSREWVRQHTVAKEESETA